MRIGTGAAETARGSAITGTSAGRKQTPNFPSDAGRTGNQGWIASGGTMLLAGTEDEDTTRKEQTVFEAGDKSDILKAYEAASKGYEYLVQNLSSASKVPYGHLAKDGVIEYKGVLFVCDEQSNSICLGDMTDSNNVINIPLSGGGCLKVNRDNIGQLSKAISMFSPEDINRILRALHQDAKVRSKQKEIDDLKAGVGEEIASGSSDAVAEADDPNAFREENQESETDTEIIVNPDGSRTLMVTTNVGGMKSTMSLEISKPTSMANDSNQVNDRNLADDRNLIDGRNLADDKALEAEDPNQTSSDSEQ